MIGNLQITGFRSFENLHLDELGQVNLVVGPGGSGKTNLLEALFLFCSNGDPLLLLKVLGLRNISTQEQSLRDIVGMFDWFWLAPRNRAESFALRGTWSGEAREVSVSELSRSTVPIGLEAEDQPIREHTKDVQQAVASYRVKTKTAHETHEGHLYLKLGPPEVKRPNVANLPARFVAPYQQGRSYDLAHIWTQVEDAGEAESVTNLMRSLDHGITDLRLASDENRRAYLRIQHARLGRIPLEFLGGGFGKALAIACYTVAAEGGLLLIDEFDASLHVAAQPSIVAFTMEAARRHNVQLVVSTHSLETVDLFVEQHQSTTGLYASGKDFRTLQLYEEEGRTQVRNLDAEKAKRLREEIGFDLRRTA